MSAGTLCTDPPLFTVMLMLVTVIATGLTYFPVLALGPLSTSRATSDAAKETHRSRVGR